MPGPVAEAVDSLPNVALTPKRELAGRIRLEKPAAPENEVLLEAGFAVATAHNPAANSLDSRKFANEVARRERGKDLTPSAARVVALSYLHGVLEQAERPEVKVVAAKQLLDYGMNAPELEPELSGRDARIWKRSEQLKMRLRALRAVQRMGTAWLERYLASKLDTATGSGETPPHQSSETPAYTGRVR